MAQNLNGGLFNVWYNVKNEDDHRLQDEEAREQDLRRRNEAGGMGASNITKISYEGPGKPYFIVVLELVSGYLEMYFLLTWYEACGKHQSLSTNSLYVDHRWTYRTNCRANCLLTFLFFEAPRSPTKFKTRISMNVIRLRF